MNDARLARLAALIVGYSLGLGRGQLVRFDGREAAAPLLLSLRRAALEAGAHPFLNVELEGELLDLLALGDDEQLGHLPGFRRRQADELDALVTVWSEVNTRELSGVDPRRQALWHERQEPLRRQVRERFDRGELAWCGLLYPTVGFAQDAGMSLAEFEDFVFRACHVDGSDDPVAFWAGQSARLHDHARFLSRFRELRLVGPDTDLTLGVAGRRWLVADGRINMPDGEVYTSPLEARSSGTIRFDVPVLDHGREFADVVLTLAGGRIVSAEAGRGGAYLRELLAVPGADVLGEVGIGLNYDIDRFTLHTLFDEKIGGTVHVAPGNAFALAGGENRSAIHVDMVCDLRVDGEIYGDGELFWRAGRFLDLALD